MKRIYVLFITMCLILNCFFTSTYAYEIKFWGTPGAILFYNEEHDINILELLDSKYKNATLSVNMITDGEKYSDCRSLFDGDIDVYDINLYKDGIALDVTIGEKPILHINDEEHNVGKTADIYYFDSEGHLIDLKAFRSFYMDANMAIFSSFGTFIVTDAKLVDESVLFVPTPSPAPTEDPDKIDKIIKGDLNSDGYLSADDALVVLLASAKMIPLNEFIIDSADLNDDQYVDAYDALIILKKASKLE